MFIFVFRVHLYRNELKPYQLIGLNWLRLMHSQHLNGILADEMVSSHTSFSMNVRDELRWDGGGVGGRLALIIHVIHFVVEKCGHLLFSVYRQNSGAH